MKIAISRLIISILFSTCFTPASAETFSVVAFNTWGVPFAAYDRWRYAEAMEQISVMSPDFVVLQEVFTGKGRKAFRDEDYPYRANGPKALPRLVSSGLRILSKHPIERSATLVYRMCKKDDCLSRKGALLAVVQLPSGSRLNLVVTHLNARGEDAIRQDQIDQLKDFLDYYAEENAPTLIVGDFNFNPTSPLYPKLLSDFGMKDAWTETHSAQDLGITYDCKVNTYARDYALKYNFPLTVERIDFLLTRGLQSKTSELIFNQGEPLSDHYGIKAEFDTDSDVSHSLAEVADAAH